MQKPVIQRIKRRAEVCRSLPVTCGRRGNDTGNGLVTVVSLRCAVDCSLKNGKSPHSKPFTFSLPPSAKCRQSMFFTRCPPHIRNRPETVRSKRGSDFRVVGTLRPLDHANLPRFIREFANRRSHAASAVKGKRSDNQFGFRPSFPSNARQSYLPRYFIRRLIVVCSRV